MFESYVADMKVGDNQVELALWDTAGQEEYDRLRPLSYPNAHVILICFSVDAPDSLENVEDKWAPEVLHFCSKPPVPYLLIGCKKDLRLDYHILEGSKKTGQLCVAFKEGEQLAKKVGARMYLECSAKTGEGVAKVFEEAAGASLHTKYKSNKCTGCVIV